MAIPRRVLAKTIGGHLLPGHAGRGGNQDLRGEGPRAGMWRNNMQFEVSRVDRKKGGVIEVNSAAVPSLLPVPWGATS